MEFNQSSHSIYKTEYHVVLVTKYQRKALSPGLAKYTEAVIKDIPGKIPGVIINELNVQPEHVHIYIGIPLKCSVATVIEILKSRSAKVVREKFEWLDKVYYGNESLWSVGYFVSTVGIDDLVIRNYVKYQSKHDSDQLKIEFS